jgi:hypothetical protein
MTTTTQWNPPDWWQTADEGTFFRHLTLPEEDVAGGEEPYRIRRHIFGIGRARFGALLFCG